MSFAIYLEELIGIRRVGFSVDFPSDPLKALTKLFKDINKAVLSYLNFHKEGSPNASLHKTKP